MASVGRNEPCPCGSGKKYKRCCANEAPANVGAPPRRDDIHALDNALFGKMLRFAATFLGPGWDPFEDYPCELYQDDMEGPLAQLLAPWAVYENRYEDENGQDRTIAARFHEARRTSLSERERTWLDAQSRASLSIWEVERIERGVGVDAHDLLTGEKRFVSEVMLTQTVRLRDTLLARVVDTPSGGAVFCGTHPSTLPPPAAAEVVKILRKAWKQKRGPVSREVLQEASSSDDLISLWDEIVEIAATAPLPALQNTDGDPLLLTVDRYTMKAGDRGEIMRQLLALPGADPHGDLEAGGAEERISFSRGGNSELDALSSTVVGTAVVSGATLHLETNSVRRADDLRARVESACGKLVRHKLRDHTDPEVLLRDGKGAGDAPKQPLPPEAFAMLREIKAKHYKEWLDSPIPALGGKTPRAAMRRKADREKLDLLLRDMEHSESQVPEEERFDISSLRATLGL